MVVFNKKRIEIIISCVIIALFVFSVQISNNKNTKDEKNINESKSILETTATPASGKTITISFLSNFCSISFKNSGMALKLYT